MDGAMYRQGQGIETSQGIENWSWMGIPSDVTFNTEASKLVSKNLNISHRSTVLELDSFCQKHVIYDVWSFIHLKTMWLLHIWFKWSEPKYRFLYIILYYNAFALLYFYPNLYIKVKWSLPMK